MIAVVDPRDLAAGLVSQKARLEYIPRDPAASFRYYVHDFPHPFASWNYHPEYEIHLILKSSGSCVVGDVIDSFSPGQITLIGPNLPHHWISDVPKGETLDQSHAVLHFSGEWINGVRSAIPELEALDSLLRRSRYGIEFQRATAKAAAAAMVRIGEADDEFERIIRVFELLRVMAHAPARDTRQIVRSWLPTNGDPAASDLVGAAIDYILDNLASTPRLSDAARMCSMSDSTFSRYFKAASGQTFSGMVGRLRLIQACRLLERTDDTIASIATTVGYQNISNFNRRFLAAFEVTPREYRLSHRQTGASKVR